MSITIAMPRMSADPELTTAQSKYVESLARRVLPSAGGAGRPGQGRGRGAGMRRPAAARRQATLSPASSGRSAFRPAGAQSPAGCAEPKLLHAFLAADKPILGICRGIQVLNAFLGGELYQDIKPLEHLPHNDHWAKIHTVTVRRGPPCWREILKQDTVLVNSQHHQAASRVAPGLEIAALSEDGFIEALEKPDATFCLGVQWHPEWLSEADPRQQALFDAFVKACH